jgi:hypothetical protein
VKDVLTFYMWCAVYLAIVGQDRMSFFWGRPRLCPLHLRVKASDQQNRFKTIRPLGR